MRNPLTQVSGPEFLGLFAIFIVAVALVCWYRSRSRDKSMELPVLPTHTKVDPYEIAYLRAGENELARVLIVGLMTVTWLAALFDGCWKFTDQLQVMVPVEPCAVL